MSDDLYEHDIVSWSERQAALLRRLARGERVNDVDWEHVIEEIEDVGISELNAVRSQLRQILVHLLKLYGWPDSPSVNHWRGEVAAFQADAVQRFSPGMRQRIDLDELYRRALWQVEDSAAAGDPSRPWPAACPASLDDLLGERRPVLEGRFGVSGAGSPSGDPS
ncbi:MAG TPA: DUF29 domain-containing protein [Rhodopila sp.]|nr:DUF29 domain-containing protein [Rhodopila sp.]